MTIDIKWMVENLATKDDVSRIREDVSRIEKSLDDQRTATHALRNTLNVDIAKRLMETEQRVSDVEAFQRTQVEERRDHVRRGEDRRRQRVTWVLTLLAPLLVVIAWGWQGLLALLKALHIVGAQ